MSQVRTNSLVPAAGIPAGANGGGIIQITQTVQSSTTSTTSSSFTDISGMSVSITPKSTSNKVFVLVNIAGATSGGITEFRLLRGGTDIARLGATFYNNGDPNNILNGDLHFLDSPATTSSTTYKMQFRNFDSNTTFVNRNTNNSTTATNSSITVMEVSG